jgi:NhaA family Na+:H+ antiporter
MRVMTSKFPRSNKPEPRSTGDFVSSLLRQEAFGGGVLTIALFLGIAWASLFSASYSHLTTASVFIPTIPHHIINNVSTLVTSLFMIVFFAAIGLEIGRERATGTLRELRSAIAPVVAALGGMAAAAGVFALTIVLDGNRSALAGWGIPMATDVAFTLGALSLLGGRVSKELRVFLLTLAVADDVASVIVLGATSHSGAVHSAGRAAALTIAALFVIALAFVVRRVAPFIWLFVTLAIALWWLLAQLGIEPTLAGVVIGVLVPSGSEGTLPGPRLERIVAPLSIFLILPVFSCLVGGVNLSTRPWSHQGGLLAALIAARSIGKVIGILGGVALVTRLNIGDLPGGASWRQMIGAALLCGIGFTVPLLFAGQVFGASAALLAATKVGLLVASLLCGILGLLILARSSPAPSKQSDADKIS